MREFSHAEHTWAGLEEQVGWYLAARGKQRGSDSVVCVGSEQSRILPLL